jgi:hypothetical protein
VRARSERWSWKFRSRSRKRSSWWNLLTSTRSENWSNNSTRGVSRLIVALILGWKTLTRSSPWTFLKSIRIGFGARGVAEVDAAGARRSARETSRRAARDFL